MDNIGKKQSLTELLKALFLSVIIFLVLNNAMGYIIHNVYMKNNIPLPAPTRLVVAAHYFLLYNQRMIIKTLLLVFALFLLVENFIIKKHKYTYIFYRSLKVILIWLNIIVVISVFLSFLKR